ncbi:histidine ammonia-lyase [Pedobacter steynii]|uniref:Histidine ammonia-lyase n=1 Tax=Pedobacter steynii TaxID=430522 RepID=A0A1H0F231_9SPHI|nr:histidine ammonia-lyase [Pedobacter steynii]NQX42236.1 histidine ammonia-lyase [Pedobacter steynii]SDN88606.1 histidine ammonia-lyase [Pedobacter steynii]
MSTYQIGLERLSLSQIAEIITEKQTLQLSDAALAKIEKCRNYLDDKLKRHDGPIYGINTGFGYLQNVEIESEKLSQLQHNLLLSHACGTGEEVSPDIVRLMLLLKIQSLSYGHSAIALTTVQRLVDFYNNDILPVIYTQGSLGASGDLAPLAHLALPLIGEGIVLYKGVKTSTKDLYQTLGWETLKLQSKEGLALINGTQFMSSYGVFCLLKAQSLAKWADAIAAISIDGFDCRIDPFDTFSHVIRPHAGQVHTAQNISKWLSGSELIKREGKQTQDPYSFRCVPQVHGASKDSINYIQSVFETEINSVTDNPNVFPDEDRIISAGNFHGQPLALTLDFLCIALAEFGSISERRTFQLISGQRGLPPFLVKDAGLNSGLMITQYTAASIASENKQLCTPASVDSIVSSNGQEDHVSMGANAATKCLRVVNNLERILAIELLTAAQALDLRKPLASSQAIEALIANYRKVVSFNDADRLLATDIAASVTFLRTEKI